MHSHSRCWMKIRILATDLHNDGEMATPQLMHCLLVSSLISILHVWLLIYLRYSKMFVLLFLFIYFSSTSILTTVMHPFYTFVADQRNKNHLLHNYPRLLRGEKASF